MSWKWYFKRRNTTPQPCGRDQSLPVLGAADTKQSKALTNWGTPLLLEHPYPTFLISHWALWLTVKCSWMTIGLSDSCPPMYPPIDSPLENILGGATAGLRLVDFAKNVLSLSLREWDAIAGAENMLQRLSYLLHGFGTARKLKLGKEPLGIPTWRRYFYLVLNPGRKKTQARADSEHMVCHQQSTIVHCAAEMFPKFFVLSCALLFVDQRSESGMKAETCKCFEGALFFPLLSCWQLRLPIDVTSCTGKRIWPCTLELEE